jgi:AsmA protein
LIPKARELEFDADVKLNQFPWTYVKELIAEIRLDAEPTAKLTSASQMEWLTTDLHLITAIRTFPFDIHRLELRNSKAAYRLADGRTFAVDNIEANVEPLLFIHPKDSGATRGVARSKGNLSLTGLRVPGLKEFNISLNVDGKDNQLDLIFNSQTQRAKSEEGRLRLDFSVADPTYLLAYKVKQVPVENFIKKISKKTFAGGLIDYSLDLKSHGKGLTTVRDNLAGTIEITSDSLRLYGVDIDDVLTKYKKSQRFNLTDVGAVILAGPVGIVATKGTEFVVLSRVNMNDTQYSTLDTLVARWKLDHLLLSTEDVAFTTPHNRIAFVGSLDFAHDSIPGLQIAVVDKNGCSLMDQQIYGKLSALKTGKLNVAKTLLGSVINFANSIVGKDCKPIYVGSVRNPKPPGKGRAP